MFSTAPSVCDIKKLTLASQGKKGTCLPDLDPQHLTKGAHTYILDERVECDRGSQIPNQIQSGIEKKKNCGQFFPNVKFTPFKNSEIILSIFYIVLHLQFALSTRQHNKNSGLSKVSSIG